MSVNSRFAVAVHVLALLSLEEGPLTSKYIAGSVNTNPVVIRRILGVLCKAGLVTTQLGAEGGAILACSPEQITLLDVYHVVEPGDLFALHRSSPNEFCVCGGNIQPVLGHVFKEAEAAMRTVLAETTIARIGDEVLRCQT